jgi:hypothetical protein
MSVKAALEKLHKQMHEDKSDGRFPVYMVGVEIGSASAWMSWECEEDNKIYFLFENFRPLDSLKKAFDGWDNILFDYEDGEIHKYTDKVDSWNVDWDFPISIVAILISLVD